MYKFVANHVFAPLLDVYRGTKTMKCLSVLEKTQWLSLEEIRQLQRERLAELIQHAYQTVPYYNQVFKERRLTPRDIKTPDDLVKLPILRREDVRRNFDTLISRGFPKREMILQSTGGSTGEPLRFYKTKKDMHSYGGAAKLQAYRWAGYDVGDKYALIGGAPFAVGQWPSFPDRVSNFFKRCVALHSRQMSEKSMQAFARKLENFQSVMIKGYPSALYLFASFIKHNNMAIRPKGVVTGGETLFDYHRRTIEEAFGCKVYDSYGSYEAPAIACECYEHSGYHIAVENVIVEVTDDNGEPRSPGEIGHIRLTNLHNYAMPLIRYEIGDLGALSEETCPCGRSLPLLKAIEGRGSEMLFGSEGRIIMPVFVPSLFRPGCTRSPSSVKQFEKIKQFQVVQEAKGEVIIKIIKDQNSSEEEFAYILTNFREHLGNDIRLNMEFVNSIPALPSGKRSYVVSRLAKEYFEQGNYMRRTGFQ